MYYMTYGGFYAVVVVCLVVLTAIVCCLGIRVFRRAALKDAQNAEQLRPNEEWQPLRNVMSTTPGPIDDETRQDLERVLGNEGEMYEGHNCHSDPNV